MQIFLLTVFIMTTGTALLAGEISYNERFALSDDRAAALEELIPGTEDFYYYNALHLELAGKLVAGKKMLDAGVKKYGHTTQLRELENRYALKAYSDNPDDSLKYITRQLNLNFNHRQKKMQEEVRLPTTLNKELISFETLARYAVREKRHTDRFEDSAFDYLVTVKLTADQRRSLLSRLRRPDYPHLVSLIIDDLNTLHSNGFGHHAVHRMLTIQQLEACLKKKPELIKQSNFINIYLSKLRPGDDVHLKSDAKEYAAYLQRLLTFADRLPQAQNSLKANIVYSQLEFNQRNGIYDKPLFMGYIKMPRPVPYINPKWFNKREHYASRIDLNASFQPFMALPPIRNDEKLVRQHLMAYLKEAADFNKFTDYIEYNYLKQLFAEVKLVNGKGDAQEWYALMDNPVMVKNLRDRIDIDLLPTNQKYYAPEEQVSLDIALKNINELTVKVYDINTTSYYRQQLSEITTGIELDGLVPNRESSKKYSLPPMRRHVETLTFPEIKHAGVYVIELIGNGVSSRALIRMGQLTFTERIGAAGHVFKLYDTTGKPIREATLWMAGTEYKAEDGEIHVPFSGSPKKQQVVLTADFSVLRSFQHLDEKYHLKAGIYLDREQLVAGKECTVTVRPELLLHGEPVDISLLENPTLTIHSLDLDDLKAKKQVNDFTLNNDKESIHSFRVPNRLRSMTVTLSGKVQNLNSGKKIDLSAQTTIAANQINESEKIEDIFLRRTADGYVAELLGRNGEAHDGRAVHLEIKHRDFKETVQTSLKTDARGRVYLGTLKDIVWITMSGPEETGHTWQIPEDMASHTPIHHILAGEPLRIPVMHLDNQPLHKVVSLLETRNNVFVRDAITHIRQKAGYLLIEDLPPGDYSLMTKPDQRITRIRVTAGKVEGTQLLGKNRVLEQKASFPLQIEQVKVTDDEVFVKIGNAVPGTRVHLAMTRYVTDNIFNRLGVPSFRRPTAVRLIHPVSQYLSGRRIGDEYRYVMERKKGRSFPGNMLTRPSLLLNPWSPKATSSTRDQADEGDVYNSLSAEGMHDYLMSPGEPPDDTGLRISDQFSSFDFLDAVSPIALNLEPDKNGVVTLPVNNLPTGQQLHVYAVNGTSAVYRQLPVKEQQEKTEDLRLQRLLDPDSHFVEQKRTTVVRQGETFTVADILSARLEVVDSVSTAYRLLTALNSDPTLAEFSFIINWPEYSREKKQELYNKYGCHELHLFLAMKDPIFFKEVVQPYIASKKDTTFIDDWLLARPLDGYLEPWSYNRLNMFERALLAQQMKGQHTSTARHLKDLHDLIPPDIEKFNRHFDSALQSSGLEAGSDKLGMVMEEAENDGDMIFAEVISEPLGFALPGKSQFTTSADAPMPVVSKTRAGRILIQQIKEIKDTALLKKKAVRKARVAAHERESRQRKAVDLKRRASIRQLYRKLEKTNEWVENNYYHRQIHNQAADLIEIDGFWKEYANWDGTGGFLSGNLSEAGDSFTEILLALAVLDLPFKAKEHKYQYKDGSLIFTAGSDLILFHQQVQKDTGDMENPVLLVNQSFFALDDRYRYENNERSDKFVTGEFEKGRVYGCQIVLSNPTSSRRKVDILQQIPAGAIPVLSGMQTRSRHAVLEPYSTGSQEYFFYFPTEGEFPHYPVHLAQDGEVVAAAEPFFFKVVSKVDAIDLNSWEYVSQSGTGAEVLAFIDEHNINRLNLDMIAWRMRDRDFFEKTLALLSDRKVYNNTLWSYSIYHDLKNRIRQYLPFTALPGSIGRILVSPLLDVDPIIRHTYEHKEYWPLVNSRVYKLGKKHKILNKQFYEQYESFMKTLTYRPVLTDEDKMTVVVYMLFQDRIAEAISFFKAVNNARLEMDLPYDYMAAYIAFFQGKPEEAATIAAKYRDTPVDRWRNMFRDILAQVDEINGKSFAVVDAENRTQAQTMLADTAPRLQFALEASVLKIDHANLRKCVINYYPMNIELLFSRKPFVQDVGTQFTFIKPNRSDTIQLDGDEAIEIKVPEQLREQNLMIEVTAAGISRLTPYYPNGLQVDLMENYGQLRVADKKKGNPLAQVYIKVYSRTGSEEVTFYKDGYTDLRGRFDYASLNTDEIDSVSRFAILVLSDSNGAMVREVRPPRR